MGTYSRGYGYQFSVGDYFPRAIKTICIICIAVFFVQELSGLIKGAEGWNFWVLWFGLSPDSLARGYIWQPLTYLFFHGGVLTTGELQQRVYLGGERRARSTACCSRWPW